MSSTTKELSIIPSAVRCIYFILFSGLCPSIDCMGTNPISLLLKYLYILLMFELQKIRYVHVVLFLGPTYIFIHNGDNVSVFSSVAANGRCYHLLDSWHAHEDFFGSVPKPPSDFGKFRHKEQRVSGYKTILSNKAKWEVTCATSLARDKIFGATLKMKMGHNCCWQHTWIFSSRPKTWRTQPS